MPRKPLRLASLLCLSLTCALARPAQAHRTRLDAGFETGSGSLVQEYVSGQWGFTPTIPFYLGGEASHEVFYEKPADNAYRFAGKAGYESVHYGAELRGGYLSGSFEGLSLLQIGGTIAYRFVRHELIPPNEATAFRHAALAAEEQRRRRELAEWMPKAPMAGLNYDFFEVGSLMSRRGSVTPMRFEGWCRTTWVPYWTVAASVAFYVHPSSPAADAAAYPSYSSPALRLVRLGPGGHYSGIFGLPEDTQQISSELSIFPQLKLNAAITRVSLATPAVAGYSFWLGFDRYLTSDQRWSIAPSYELYVQEKKAYSYFMVAIRFGEGTSYVPVFGTTP